MIASYSSTLIRFILINYLDLSCGLSPRVMDEMKTFLKRRGGSLQQTATIWKADVDASISSLATKRGDVWSLIATGITPGMLEQAGKHPLLSNLQKRIINGCMLEPCSGCSGKYAPSYCENRFILKKMRDYLNGINR